MNNVLKVAMIASTLAVSSTALAGEPVGAAMVSSKVTQQTAAAVTTAASNQVAAARVQSFQWGSTPARTEATTERVVKTKSLVAKPSVITWPSSTGIYARGTASQERQNR